MHAFDLSAENGQAHLVFQAVVGKLGTFPVHVDGVTVE
jgi:hypothetical protein